MDIRILPEEDETERTDEGIMAASRELVVPDAPVVRPMVVDGVAECWYKGVASSGSTARLLSKDGSLYEGPRTGNERVYHAYPGVSPPVVVEAYTNGVSRMSFFLLCRGAYGGNHVDGGSEFVLENVGLPETSSGWTGFRADMSSPFFAGKTVMVGGGPIGLPEDQAAGCSPEGLDHVRIFMGLSLPSRGNAVNFVASGLRTPSASYIDSWEVHESYMTVSIRDWLGTYTRSAQGMYVANSFMRVGLSIGNGFVFGYPKNDVGNAYVQLNVSSAVGSFGALVSTSLTKKMVYAGPSDANIMFDLDLGGGQQKWYVSSRITSISRISPATYQIKNELDALYCW